jgi:glycosyltransferase involved in cell wall biosynthesis
MNRSADVNQEDSVHVLHIVSGLPPGGMELAMARLIRATESRRLRHTVVCLKGEPVIADAFPATTAIHSLHSRPNDPRLPWQLWRLICQAQPTVIHARNWGAWPDVALARLLAWPVAPLVFSFHGLAGTAPMPLRRRIAFHVLSRMTTCLVTVCEAAKRMLVERFRWPSPRVHVIPNGVDTQRFSPHPRQPGASHRLVIGSVGSLTSVKNHSLLVHAFAALLRAGVDCELRIAGEGPERSATEKLAGELGIASRILLCGHLDDVPQFLRGLDVFALPSSSEAHPNALLEAMSCGLPCVATDVGGVAEVLDSGRCGRLSPAGDVERFSAALRDLCDNRDARRSLAAAARKQVEDSYDLSAMVAAYERLYRGASRRDRHALLHPASPASPSAANRPAHAPGIAVFAVKQGSLAKSASREVDDGRRPEPKRLRLLHLGPLPPLTGGMATVIDSLLNSKLNESFEMFSLNTGKTTQPDRTLAEGVLAQVKLLARLVGVLRRKQIRVVHLHTCEFLGFWRDCVHALVARAMGCRVIWHVHGARFDQWAAKQGPCRRAVIRAAFERASAVIVLSEQWRQKLAPFAPRARWRVVPNGISMPELPAPLPTGSARFLFLGDWTPRKGVADLVAAVSLASSSLGFSGSVALAGFEKEPGQRDRLEQLVGRCGCSSRIEIVGLLSGKAKEEALAAAHCLVLPSYGEGLPMALLEAMGRGRPVIATRVGAIPELITEGREGFLIEPGDVNALADRLARVASDAELVSRQGSAARRRVEEEYSFDAMISQITDLYATLT